MKRNFFYLTIITLIFLMFLNYDIVLSSTIEGVNIWLYKVFPYLFMMIIINDLLISTDFRRIFKSNTSYIFIMSLLSGTPTSAYIINGLYKENKISKNNANLSLLFTYFCNPLFLYSILLLIFNDLFIVIKLMIIHYLSNLIIYFIFHKKLDKESTSHSKAILNLSKAIKKSMSTTTMVLGTIVLYLVISNIIIHTLAIRGMPNILFKGLLEVTQGLNSLINLCIPHKIKEIIAIAFISFGGLSIHTQIKCILDETFLEYKYFLYGRFLQTTIAIVLTAMT